MTSGFLNTLRALFTSSKPTADDSSEDLETEPPFDDAIVLPLEDHIDLHPFAPRDIPSVVEEYLEQCLEHGFVDVRIIHGRGQGVQRRIVRSLLTKHARVKPKDPNLWYVLAEIQGRAGNIFGVHRSRAEYFAYTGALKSALEQLGYALPLAKDPVTVEQIESRRLFFQQVASALGQL